MYTLLGTVWSNPSTYVLNSFYTSLLRNFAPLFPPFYSIIISKSLLLAFSCYLQKSMSWQRKLYALVSYCYPVPLLISCFSSRTSFLSWVCVFSGTYFPSSVHAAFSTFHFPIPILLAPSFPKYTSSFYFIWSVFSVKLSVVISVLFLDFPFFWVSMAYHSLTTLFSTWFIVFHWCSSCFT
jgi:hypothetical protein